MRERLGVFLWNSQVFVVCTVLAVVFGNVVGIQKEDPFAILLPPFDLCTPIMRMILSRVSVEVYRCCRSCEGLPRSLP